VSTIISNPPDAGDEYTLAQRRVVDARLAEGLADIRAGRKYGPFDTVDAMIDHMKVRLTWRRQLPLTNY
jgi:hypothetical protein